jgi:hypothetical protein
MGVYNAGLLFLQATEPVHLHDTAGSPNPSKDQKKQRQLPKSNPEKYAKHEHMERHRSDEGTSMVVLLCSRRNTCHASSKPTVTRAPNTTIVHITCSQESREVQQNPMNFNNPSNLFSFIMESPCKPFSKPPVYSVIFRTYKPKRVI